MHASHVVAGSVDVIESLHVVQLAPSWSHYTLSIPWITRVDIDSSGRSCVYSGGHTQSFPDAGERSGPLSPALRDSGGVFIPETADTRTLLIGPQITQVSSGPGYPYPKDLVDRIVRDRLLESVGPHLETIQTAVTTFFNTLYVKFPIISRKRVLERLSGGIDKAPADFTALCLCINLLLQPPSQETQSMQTPLYVTVKNTISLLESTGHYLSLEQIQCRLVVTFYEIGHGISPAASVSIAACARMARALGLHESWHQPIRNTHGSVQLEEERRVWWAVFNLDR